MLTKLLLLTWDDSVCINISLANHTKLIYKACNNKVVMLHWKNYIGNAIDLLQIKIITY